MREMFRRYAEDGESIGRIARWLAEQGVTTRTGKTGWNTATIWGILRNPAYAGQAAHGKTHATGRPVRETRHARQRGKRSARVAREGVSPEEWKAIAVPALVTAERFALVQQQLARNSRFSPRNTRRPSLLQGILTCRECGYAYYRCSTRSKNGLLREYYRCSGTDGHRRPEGRVGDNRPVRLAEIDELAWNRVLGLLDDPALLQAEIDRRLHTLRAAHPATTRRDALQRDLTRAQNALRRLLDGYQEQLVTLDELRARTQTYANAKPLSRRSWTRSTPSWPTPRPTSSSPRRSTVPRARLQQRREPDHRTAPTDHPARRPRGPDRRRRRHDPPLHPDHDTRPAAQLSTAFG